MQTAWSYHIGKYRNTNIFSFGEQILLDTRDVGLSNSMVQPGLFDLNNSKKIIDF